MFSFLDNLLVGEKPHKEELDYPCCYRVFSNGAIATIWEGGDIEIETPLEYVHYFELEELEKLVRTARSFVEKRKRSDKK